MLMFGRPDCQFQIADTLQLPMIALVTWLVPLPKRRPWPKGSSQMPFITSRCGRWVSW